MNRILVSVMLVLLLILGLTSLYLKFKGNDKFIIKTDSSVELKGVLISSSVIITSIQKFSTTDGAGLLSGVEGILSFKGDAQLGVNLDYVKVEKTEGVITKVILPPIKVISPRVDQDTVEVKSLSNGIFSKVETGVKLFQEALRVAQSEVSAKAQEGDNIEIAMRNMEIILKSKLGEIEIEWE